MINKIIHSCLQIWNFFSRVQLDTNSIQSIFFCSIPYSFTSLTHEIANWKLEEKFVIKVHLCFIIHLLNKDKMADFVIQPRCKIPEKLSYSTNFNAWRGSIAQWSVFIRLYNHRLLTTEKVVDECKAIKPVNKCSRKNCQRLKKSLLCHSGIVVLTYPHLNTRGGWGNNKCSRSQRLEKRLLCRSGIVVLTYPHLNTRGGWENLRKLCKPET